MAKDVERTATPAGARSGEKGEAKTAKEQDSEKLGLDPAVERSARNLGPRHPLGPPPFGAPPSGRDFFLVWAPPYGLAKTGLAKVGLFHTQNTQNTHFSPFNKPSCGLRPATLSQKYGLHCFCHSNRVWFSQFDLMKIVFDESKWF